MEGGAFAINAVNGYSAAQRLGDKIENNVQPKAAASRAAPGGEERLENLLL